MATSQELPQWLTQWAESYSVSPLTPRVEQIIDDIDAVKITGTIPLPVFEENELREDVFLIEISPDEEEQFMSVEIQLFPLDGQTARTFNVLQERFLDEWHDYEKTQLTPLGIHSRLGNPNVSEEEKNLPAIFIQAPFHNEDEEDQQKPFGVYIIFEEIEYEKNPQETLRKILESTRSYWADFDQFSRWYITNRIPELEARLQNLPPTWIEDYMNQHPQQFSHVTVNNTDNEHMVNANYTYQTSQGQVTATIEVAIEDTNRLTNELAVTFPMWIAQTEEEKDLLERISRLETDMSSHQWLRYEKAFKHEARKILTDKELKILDTYNILPTCPLADELPEGLYIHVFKSSIFDEADTEPDETFIHMMRMLPKLQPVMVKFLNGFIQNNLLQLEEQRAHNTEHKPAGWLGNWAAHQNIGLEIQKIGWIEPEAGINPFREAVVGLLANLRFAAVSADSEFHKNQLTCQVEFPDDILQMIGLHYEAFKNNLSERKRSDPLFQTNVFIGHTFAIPIRFFLSPPEASELEFDCGFTVTRDMWNTLKQVGWTKEQIFQQALPQFLRYVQQVNIEITRMLSS